MAGDLESPEDIWPEQEWMLRCLWVGCGNDEVMVKKKNDQTKLVREEIQSSLQITYFLTNQGDSIRICRVQAWNFFSLHLLLVNKTRYVPHMWEYYEEEKIQGNFCVQSQAVVTQEHGKQFGSNTTNLFESFTCLLKYRPWLTKY